MLQPGGVVVSCQEVGQGLHGLPCLHLHLPGHQQRSSRLPLHRNEALNTAQGLKQAGSSVGCAGVTPTRRLVENSSKHEAALQSLAGCSWPEDCIRAKACNTDTATDRGLPGCNELTCSCGTSRDVRHDEGPLIAVLVAPPKAHASSSASPGQWQCTASCP